MTKDNFEEKQGDNIAIHIFTVSATMIGVCLTVIGIMHVSNAYKRIIHLGDDITAIDALVFLLSCFLSFLALRTRDRRRRLFIEKMADMVFLTGLSAMVVICFLIVYKFV